MPAMANRSFSLSLALIVAAAVIGALVGGVIHAFWDLPEVRQLEEFRPSITTRVYSASDRLLAEFFIENRTPVDLRSVPPVLIAALIATEDRHFYSHRGLDAVGILRAAYRNVRAGKIVEGGSTLTQQLAKVLFLTPERSFTRKLKEMALALKIEQQYTKQEILALYLNQIYFGNGAYGVESAAQAYFGKTARELTLAESALLAGLPRSPRYYSPFRAPESARSRRAHVLRRMVATGIIAPAQAEDAIRTALPIPPAPALRSTAPAPYFVEYVRQKVEERFGSSILYSGGLNIHTTLDDSLQVRAEKAVSTGLALLETNAGGRRRAPSTHPLQSALIAIDPATGHIRAMVGGRDYGASQFNRAWQALRQPGSAFKPFIFSAAIERGYSAADILSDTPVTVKVDSRKTWTPENFTRTYQGNVTLRKALSQSLNVPTVKLLSAIGTDEAIRHVRKLGIRSPLQPVLPLALGSSDVSLLELTSAYAVFANQGVRMEPVAILSVSDSNGRVLYAVDTVPTVAISPETAYLITNLLKGVIEGGTGWRARELGRPVAGKTGTTNDYRDSWFVGYTPSLVTGVWVGYDDHQQSLGPRATGARAALPIWLDFMKTAHNGVDVADFSPPATLIFRTIDPRTGRLSTENCRSSFREAFLPGTEPRTFCEEQEPADEEPIVDDEAPQE